MINYLDENKEAIKKNSEFDNHEIIKYFNDSSSGLKGFIAIHRKNSSFPSFGATRFWHYSSEADALRDALRLSKMMSYKSALAGLRYGGAKGVIMAPPNNFDKNKILSAYTDVVNELKGQFITGTDVGLMLSDIQLMKNKCPYLVGFKGDPTEFTAFGLYHSIQISVEKVFKQKSLKGMSFAIQGMGKIGSELLRLVYKDANQIFVSDIDDALIGSIKIKFPKVNVVESSQIHKQKVDVFSPCALSHSLSKETIKDLKCKIIVGGANNQLAGEDIGGILHENGILYAPDFVANAGGLISVVDEYENKRFSKKRIMEKVKRIDKDLNIIFDKSIKDNKPTSIIANELAIKIVG